MSPSFILSKRAAAAALPVLAALAALGGSAAHAGPCLENEGSPPWTAGAVGTVLPGASQGDGTTFTLCSSTFGFGHDQDAYRYLTQEALADFSMTATVSEIDPGAGAGLLVKVVGNAQTGARAVIYVDASGAEPVVRSRARLASGALDVAAPAPLPASLPVTLRLRREASTLFTEVRDGTEWALHMAVDLAGTELDDTVRVGMAQASNHRELARSAILIRAELDAPAAPPAAVCSDAKAMAASGGALVTIRGARLESVREVTLAGVAAEIVSQTRDRIVARAGAYASGRPLTGDVRLRGAGGRAVLRDGATYAGTAFVRGDVDGDGKVDRDDWRRLCYAVKRSQPLTCTASGDVNGDGVLDQDDLDQLKRYILTGDSPPAAPFPEPGVAIGEPVCGLPEGPKVTAVLDSRGKKPSGRLREGDILELRGADLPALERAWVSFGGDVGATVLGVTPGGLKVRVEHVPTTGARCPIVMEVSQEARGDLVSGIAASVVDSADLCPRFEGAPQKNRFVAGWDEERDLLTLHIPREAWDGRRRLEVRLAAFLPFLSGVSRGPRAVELDFRPLVAPAGREGGSAAPDAYAAGLAALAEAIEEAANSGDSTCQCELTATADPVAGTLTIATCFPVPDDPQPPGGPGSVLPPKVIWTKLDVLIPEDLEHESFSCDQIYSQTNDRRKWAWCQFVDLVKPVPSNFPWWEGKPYWESFIPQQDALVPGAGHSFTWSFHDPELRNVWAKRTMYEPQMASDLHLLGYSRGCWMAARRYYCGGPEKDWMPRFKNGQRLIKTFWVQEHQLPAGSNPSQFYSYQQPGMQRTYLVGMHINVTQPFHSSSREMYFRWITLWVPAAPGVTTTIGGEPLEKYYNFNCTEGSSSDRPDELLGTVWGRFAMCTNWEAGEKCGNPWGPKDECELVGDKGCINCHYEDYGHMKFPGSGHRFELAWLTGLGAQIGEAKTCMEEIEASPGLYQNKAYCFAGDLMGPGMLNDGWPDDM